MQMSGTGIGIDEEPCADSVRILVIVHVANHTHLGILRQSTAIVHVAPSAWGLETETVAIPLMPMVRR